MKKTLAALTMSALALSGCSILKPEETGLKDNIVVSSSAAPSFESRPVDSPREVTENLGDPVKDEGLNVDYQFQGVYSDDVAGTVLTIKLHNLNEVPLPPDAIAEPILERADGNGGWAEVAMLPYDAQVNANIPAPGLDRPLGAGASTNLQYRFDTTPGSLWNARLTMGNVVYVGDLNL